MQKGKVFSVFITLNLLSGNPVALQGKPETTVQSQTIYALRMSEE